MKTCVIICLSLFLASCSFLDRVKPVQVKTIAERPPMYHPPLPSEISIQNVKFEILTPQIMKEYILLVEEGKAPRKPFYALTTQNYENLAVNMAEIKRYIKQILTIVEFYRNYDKTEEQKDD